jgi:hypothetical protein
MRYRGGHVHAVRIVPSLPVRYPKSSPPDEPSAALARRYRCGAKSASVFAIGASPMSRLAEPGVNRDPTAIVVWPNHHPAASSKRTTTRTSSLPEPPGVGGLTKIPVEQV